MIFFSKIGFTFSISARVGMRDSSPVSTKYWKPASNEKSASVWPSVATTYVDGVTIVSISPETFSEDVEQEIVVKVKYELLSREEGEITLGASYGSLAARRRIGATRVKIGKGEAEIRARFIPKKTAGLPVGRLLITLSEFPHNKPSAFLAWDEATIAVKSEH